MAAVFLAAGAGQRFGDKYKLTAELGGQPVVRHGAKLLGGCGLAQVVAVTGWEQAAVEAALDGFGFVLVHNSQWADGMGGSIAAGVKALAPDVDAAFVVPGDMPFLTKHVFDVLAGVFQYSEATAPIVFPVLDRHVQTNPVLWPRRFFGALSQLSGPAGAKSLLVRNAGGTRGVAFDDPGLFRDIDTAADLEAARAFVSS